MEVNLKSNGWYNKLQEFVLGDAKPDLFSLCPYFWLTIFCIFALPFAIIIKGFKFVVKRIKTNVIQPIIDNYVNNMTFEDAALINYSEDNNKHKKASIFMLRIKSYDLFQKWITLKMQTTGKTWDEISAQMEEAYKTWKQKRDVLNEAESKTDEKAKAANAKFIAKKNARLEKRKKMWIPIVKWTKRIVNTFITLLIMFFITLAINILVEYYNGAAVWSGLIHIMWTIMWTTIAFGVGYLIYLYINWCKVNDRLPLILKPVVYSGKQIGNFFIYVGNGLGSFFGIFWSYFKANKNDYCPAINWDTDTHVTEDTTTTDTQPKG